MGLGKNTAEHLMKVCVHTEMVDKREKRKEGVSGVEDRTVYSTPSSSRC